MMYTILNARYANAQKTAVTLETQQAGSVLISEVDTPELWKKVFSTTKVQPYTTSDERPDVLEDFRTRRENYLDRLTGIAVFTDDATIKAAAKMFRQRLLDIPADPTVVNAPDAVSLQTAILALCEAASSEASTASPAGVFDKVL